MDAWCKACGAPPKDGQRRPTPAKVLSSSQQASSQVLVSGLECNEPVVDQSAGTKRSVGRVHSTSPVPAKRARVETRVELAGAQCRTLSKLGLVDDFCYVQISPRTGLRGMLPRLLG